MNKGLLLVTAAIGITHSVNAATVYTNLPASQPFDGEDILHGEYITGINYNGVTVTTNSLGSTDSVQAYYGDQITADEPDFLGGSLGIVIAGNPHTSTSFNSGTGVTRLFGPVDPEPAGGTITFELDYLSRLIIFDAHGYDEGESLSVRLYRDGVQVGPTRTPSWNSNQHIVHDLTPWYNTVFDEAVITIEGDIGVSDIWFQEVVPEPSTALLSLLGLPIALRRKRK